MKQTLLSKVKLLAVGVFLASQGYSQTTTFNYTGSPQTYTVPVGVFSITVDVYGAQGGLGYAVPAVGAGQGGRVQATVPVTPGEVLNIYVGGQGGPGGTTVGGTAGYNGGGIGGGWSGGRSGGGGGGASDIRQGGNALSNRVVVGSGGGGTGVNYSTGNRGGDGGGLVGANGLTGTYLGAGATQSAGGSPNGALGIGGNAPAGQTGGGGGGGYYGGGSSAWEGGGGGSSYTAPAVTGVTHTAGARVGNGQIIITAVIPFTAAVTQTATIQCFGQSTAALTATPSGGTSPFTYSWAPTGGNAASATGLGAGTYTVTVTDANATVTTQTFSITQPTAIVPTAASTSISCNGGANGSATAIVSGGSPSYTYAWSNGGITATISSLTSGVYSYTVTDTHGCSSTQSVTVTQPTALAVTPMQTNVTCNGGSNGDAMVMVSGGTPGYQYAWLPTGGNAASETNLVAGTYTCTITDANSCTTTQSFILSEPTLVTSSVSATSILCNGGTASVTVVGSGGVGPYTGEGTFNVGAGLYNYTITDASGCTGTTSITITEPAAITISSTQINVACFGGASGFIDLTAAGGTGPYTFNWNNNQFTTEDLIGIAAGSYSGIITDANGCQDSSVIVITEPSALVATITASTNPTSCSGTDGSINLTPSGGTPTYSYSWSNSATTEDVSGLAAGTYSCTLIDINGCSTTTTISLVDPNPPTVTVAISADTVCNLDGVFVLTGGSPAGGTYSGPGVSGGSFNPTTANAGANTITYTYTDTQTGCSASNTDIIFVDPCAGVVENTFANTFNVYPNPNNGTFTLQLNTTEIADVMIYDAQGKLVSATKVQPTMQQQISIESVGVYLITVVTADGNRSSQRVVVNR